MNRALSRSQSRPTCSAVRDGYGSQRRGMASKDSPGHAAQFFICTDSLRPHTTRLLAASHLASSYGFSCYNFPLFCHHKEIKRQVTYIRATSPARESCVDKESFHSGPFHKQNISTLEDRRRLWQKEEKTLRDQDEVSDLAVNTTTNTNNTGCIRKEIGYDYTVWTLRKKKPLTVTELSIPQ
jgi:hypothetical protein